MLAAHGFGLRINLTQELILSISGGERSLCASGKPRFLQVNIRPQRGRLWSKPRGHDLRKSHWQNSKSEYRNSKQIQISNSLMTKTKSYSRCQIRLLFGSFEFWSLNIVSDFGFRASDLVSFHFIRQSQLSLTWPRGQGFIESNKGERSCLRGT